MQNLSFVYELYMFLILKNCLVSISKHMIMLQHGSLMTQLVKTTLLITQKSPLPSLLMHLIKTVLFTFHPTKKRDYKQKTKIKILIS